MASMTFDITASDRASRELDKIADAADKVTARLEKLDKTRAEPTIDAKVTQANEKIKQLQGRLDSLRGTRIDIGLSGAEEARREVTALVVEMRKVRNTSAKLDLGTGTAKQDVREIVRLLESVRSRDVTIDVDTRRSRQEIDSIRARAERLQALSPLKLRVEVDDQATAQLEQIFATASVIDGLDPALRVDADTAAASAQLETVLAQLERIANGQTVARVRLDTLTFLGELAQVQRQLDTLSGGKVRIDADTSRLMADIAEVRVRLTQLDSMQASPEVDAETASARAQLLALERQLATIAGRRYNANVDVDTGSSMAKLLSLQGVLSGVGGAMGSVRPRTAALAAGILVLAEAAVNAAGALGAIPGALAGLGAAAATVSMGVSGIGAAFDAVKEEQEAAATAAAKSGAAQTAQASAVRSAVQGVEDAQRQASRTAEQGAQSVADAARGVEDAQRRAAQTAVDGARQVSDAQAAVVEAQRRAAEVAVDGARRVEDAQRRAAQVAVDGARQIGDAQRAVADAQQQAVERTASAEAQLERALVSRRDAQEALTRAVRDAREAQEDLALSLRGAALSEEGALISLERARERLANMPADSTALDYREAELAVRRAALAVDETRERHIDLQQESARSAQAGIDGADGVVAAQRRVEDANRGVLDAEAGVSKAREDGARSVSRAQEQLARTQEQVGRANADAIRGVSDAQQSAARANADAQRGVEQAQTQLARVIESTSRANADAQRDVARAQEQLGRAQTDAARANEDAARAVSRAQEQLAEAYTSTGDTAIEAAMKSEAALAKLAPEARRFVEAVLALKPAWSEVTDLVQNALFREVGADLTRLSDAQLPGVRDGLVRVAEGFNAGARGAMDLLTSSRGISDVRLIMDEAGRGAEAYAGSLTPITSMFLDIAAVGSPILSEIAEGFLNSATNAAVFVQNARDSGDLDEWIRGGMEELRQLGTLLVNSVEVITRTFNLADEAGLGMVDTLVRVTGGMRDYLRTVEGQNTVRAFFDEIDGAIDAAMPGVSALAQGVADMFGEFARTDGLERAATGFTDLAQAAEPLGASLGYIGGTALGMIGDTASVASAALGPVVDVTKAILDFMGPLAPAVATAAAAFLLMRPVAGIVAGAGAALSGAAINAGVWTEKATRSADAGQRVASGMDRVGGALSKASAALPLVGAAVIGAIALWEEFGSTADKNAEKVLTGSLSIEQAMAREIAQVEKNQLWWNSATQQQDAHADARRRVQEEIDRQLGQMGPMEQLQARVAMAQANLNDEVARGTENSPAARDAAGQLATAQGELERAQEGAARLTRDHTQAMIDQADQAAAIADTNLRYLDSLDRIADAEATAAAAVRDHGAGSREAEAANRDLIRANLDTAIAAREKATADAEATGATNAAEIGAQAFRDELTRLAGQAEGPTRQALLDMANGTNISEAAAATAEIQARLQKEELGRLAAQATGPLKAALEESTRNFDTLGGAHATAETRALLQKAELRRLADMASGPLRDELNRMADQIRTLPDGDITITATGMTAYTFAADGRVTGGPGPRSEYRGLATGGIWSPTGVRRYADAGIMPGYTPGRDVHIFNSPTAGRLELSGGEPVMRPEFGKAVGPGWVHAANAAARRGGVGGVEDFLNRTMPRPAGPEGRIGDGSALARGGYTPRWRQRFAGGGFFHAGRPFTSIPPTSHGAVAEEVRRVLVPHVQRKIQEFEARVRAAQAAAAAAGGGGAASGPVTAGAAAGLRWARTQAGKPYIWAGVGPRGYDCSGFISGIVNVMRGRNPHSRVGGTGTFPWPGFRAGIGPGLNVGSFRGNPGHMAGTIDGVNVESRGSAGVVVGPAARGAKHPLFNTFAHLYDRGGLARGRGLMAKATLRPERVLSARQTAAHERLTAALERAQVRRGLAADRAGAARLDVAAQVRAAVEQGMARLALQMPAPAVVAGGADRAAVAALDRAVAALAGRDDADRIVDQLQLIRGDLSRTGPSVAALAQERRTAAELGAY